MSPPKYRIRFVEKYLLRKAFVVKIVVLRQ